mgnify:CR=1 FL=1
MNLQNSSNIEHVNNLKKKDSIIILFYAIWCGACKELKPEWDKFDKGHSNNVNVGTVESAELNNYKLSSNEPSIEAYPTIRLYHKGKFIKEYDGDRSFKSIQKFADSYLKKTKGAKKSNLAIVRTKKGNNVNGKLVKQIVSNSKKNKPKQPII